MMKTILLFSAVLFWNVSFGQSKKETRYTYYPNGKVQFQYTYVNDTLNGPYTAFSENGTKRSEANYKNGRLNGNFTVYAEPGKIAFIETYRNGQLMEKIVFYQEYPDNTYKLISKTGYKSVTKGFEVPCGKSTPNGFIFTEYDFTDFQEKNYMWSNGKKVAIDLPKPDGTTETVFDGDKSGVYEWRNKKKVFIRPLNESDLKVPDLDPEIQRQLDSLMR